MPPGGPIKELPLGSAPAPTLAADPSVEEMDISFDVFGSSGVAAAAPPQPSVEPGAVTYRFTKDEPLGMFLQDRDGEVVVDEVRAGAQAAKSGVKVGSVLLALDSASVVGLSRATVIEKIHDAPTSLALLMLPPEVAAARGGGGGGGASPESMSASLLERKRAPSRKGGGFMSSFSSSAATNAGGTVEMMPASDDLEAGLGGGLPADAEGSAGESSQMSAVELTEEGYIELIDQVEEQVTAARGQKQRLEMDIKRNETTREDKEVYQKQKGEVGIELAKLETRLVELKAELKAEFNIDIDEMMESATYEPKYMKNRISIEEELENTLVDVPFEHFPLMSGQGKARCEVGKVKALVRCTELGAEWSQADLDLISELKSPQEYFVRVYVLRGNQLQSLDTTGGSDPYIVVKLGDQKRDNRAEHLDDVKTICYFDKYFELNTQLPGEGLLTIECWDYDGFGRASDDLIGKTKIDLEDRIFSDQWNQLKDRPPVERRQIYSTASSNPQGSLDLWIDIMTPEVAAANPPLDIAPPPKQARC